MQLKVRKKFMFVLCGVLLAAIAVFFAACKNSEQEQEKLLTDVKAETAVEVNTLFKPEVTLASGAAYTLSIVSVPAGAETPTVEDNAFTPDRLGEYGYKIVASKSGRENEEYSGKVTAVDTTGPVVSGEVKSFNIPKGETLTFAEMLEGLTYSDNYDTQISAPVLARLTRGGSAVEVPADSTEYTFAAAGNYEAVFTVSDSSANTTEISVSVTVGGLDIADSSDRLAYVGDTLVLPEFSIIPENSGTIKIFFDDEEISADALPVFDTDDVGEHTLAIYYYLNENDGSEPDDSVAIKITVENIEITASMDADGKEAGYKGNVPQAFVNDEKAVISVTLQRPEDDAAKSVQIGDEVEYGQAGWYTYVYTAVKGETEVSKTYKFYVKEVGEVISFEDVAGGNTWDNETTAELSGEQVKFGLSSLKLVLAANTGYAEVIYNGANDTGTTPTHRPQIGKTEFNTASVWIYSDVATTVRFGLGASESWKIDPNSSNSYEIEVGWNKVEIFLSDTADWTEVGMLRVTNLGAEQATVYVDAVCFYTDLYLTEKNVSKDVVTGTTIDLNEYFSVSGASDAARIEITADKGAVDLREYTAPSETGKATITITASEEGKTTRTLTIELNIISVSFSVPDNYDTYYDKGATIGEKTYQQVGAINPEVEVLVTPATGDPFDISTADSFKVDVTGWTTVTYTLTCDNETQPIVITKTFYVREVGEAFSFEDYTGSGKTYDNMTGGTSGIPEAVIDTAPETVKSGLNSMKLELGAGQQAMLNYATAEHASTPMDYNTIRVALHSTAATTVRLGFAQNGDPWWFVDPNSSTTYEVVEGWNEIVVNVPASTVKAGTLVAIALTNVGTAASVFHMDSIRFLTEMVVTPDAESVQVSLNSPYELTDYITVSESEAYTVSVKVNRTPLEDTTAYTFTSEGDYTVEYVVTDTASGLIKTVTITFNAVDAIITVEDYENVSLGAEIEIKASEVSGAQKNVSVSVVAPDGSETTVQEGGTYKIGDTDGGWYTVKYTLTYGDSQTKTLEKTFYAGYADEIASFENFDLDGQKYDTNTAGTATSTVEVSNEQAYFGEYSMKFTNTNQYDRAQINYSGGEGGGAPRIESNDFNKIKLWVYSETAVSVTIAIQGGGANWGWITSTEAVTQLDAGWNEITLDRSDAKVFEYIGAIFVDKKTEGTNGTPESIYIDCIRFVNETQA